MDEPPVRRRIVFDNNRPAEDAIAASYLIHTIVWAIVVLVLLGVGLYALHVYAHLF